MSARHRQPASPAQARLRALIILLVAIFLIAFFFLRGSGEDAPGDDTIPGAGAGTTTTEPGGSGSTAPDGSTTTTPGGTTSSTSNLGELQGVRLETISQDFNQPTVITAPVGDERLFVAQRVGVIRILDADREMLDPAFLDLTDRVLANGIEQG
ncbi:MAG: hypothetical protein ACRDZM_11625, partial [Acidimicrobiia bacterium]